MWTRRTARFLPWLILALVLLVPQVAHADDGGVFEQYKSKGLVWRTSARSASACSRR